MTLTRFVEPSGIVPASVVLPDWSRPRLDPSSLAVHGVGASAAAAVCDAAAALSELNGNASETLGLAKAFARLTLWRSCCAAATDAIEHEVHSGKLPKVPNPNVFKARAGQVLAASAIAAGMSPPDRGRAMPKAMEQSVNSALFVESLARVNPDLQALLLKMRPTERALRSLYRMGEWQDTLPLGTRRFQPETGKLKTILEKCHAAMVADGSILTDAGLSGAMVDAVVGELWPVEPETKVEPVGGGGGGADPDPISAGPDPVADPVAVAMNALASHSAGLLAALADLSAMTAADHGAVTAAMDSLIADVSVVLSAMAPTPEPTPEPTPAPKRGKRKVAATILTPQQAMAL